MTVNSRRGNHPGFRESLDLIQDVAGHLGAPDIAETAIELYEDASEAGEIVGRTGTEVAAACLFIAARNQQVPVTVDELADGLEAVGDPVPSDRILSVYRALSKAMDIKVAILNPDAYLPRVIEQVDTEDAVEKRASAVLEAAKDANATVGKRPSAVAASVVYLAGLYEDAGITQNEAGSAANVSPLTIRKHCREFQDYYDAEDGVSADL